jgi:hypothetical protein
VAPTAAMAASKRAAPTKDEVPQPATAEQLHSAITAYTAARAASQSAQEQFALARRQLLAVFDSLGIGKWDL